MTRYFFITHLLFVPLAVLHMAQGRIFAQEGWGAALVWYTTKAVVMESPAPRSFASRMRDGLCTRIHAALENLRKFFRTNLDWRVAEIRKVLGNGLEGDLEVGLIYANSGLFEEARGLYERALFGDRVPELQADANVVVNGVRRIGPCDTFKLCYLARGPVVCIGVVECVTSGRIYVEIGCQAEFFGWTGFIDFPGSRPPAGPLTRAPPKTRILSAWKMREPAA